MKEVTPLQYSKYLGCSVQYIHKLLLRGQIGKLPNVIEVKRYSRFYLLVVPDTLDIGQ
jgi:hypothetical protein